MNTGVHVDAHERHGDGEIEAIGEAIASVKDHRLRGEAEGQRRFDDVPLEGRVQTAPISDRRPILRSSAAIDVLDVENDFPLAQVLAFEGVVRGALEPDAETAPVATDRQRAFSEQRAETLTAAAERTERWVERIREAARRRAHGEGRQRRHQLPIELLRCLQLLDAGPEMGGMVGNVGRGRGRQDNRPAEKVRQHLRDRDATLAEQRTRAEDSHSSRQHHPDDALPLLHDSPPGAEHCRTLRRCQLDPQRDSLTVSPWTSCRRIAGPVRMRFDSPTPGRIVESA